MNFDFDDDGRIVVLPKYQIVELLPYVPRTPKQFEYMSDAELQNGKGGFMLFDTESYPNYFLIAFKDYYTKKIIKLEAPFDPYKLSWILHNYTVVGFNSRTYDIPLVWYSYFLAVAQYSADIQCERIKSASNDLVSGMYFRELEKEYGFQIYPTPHIDLIEVCPLRGSLKLYGARLHSERIQELPYYHLDELTDEQKFVVSDYCVNDLDNTELCFETLFEPLKLRNELSMQYRQDLMSKSDAQIAEAVISSELKNISGKWPKKPQIKGDEKLKYHTPSFVSFQTERLQQVLRIVEQTEFGLLESGRMVVPDSISELKIQIANGVYRMGAGGLHSSEKCMAVTADDEHELIDRDVASYYPAIVLNLGLYPQHLGQDFLTVYKDIVDRRLKAKKAKNLAVSECLKITINGTFGKSGSPYSVLYAPEMMIQITITGQLCLLMLIEQMELNGIQVVSANTDGFVMRVHKSKKDKMNELITMWEKLTGFQTEETKYKAIYARDVNAYMAIKENDEVKGKNIYYDPWRGKTAKDKYWTFQKNPQAQICVEAIENLILKNIPIEKTIEECKDIRKFVCVKNVKGGAHKDRYYLGKVVRWYHSKDVKGTINYINNNNKVPDTDGARPCMDLPASFPDDIDYQWYVSRTTDMLTDMGYLKKKEQLRFF